MAVPSYALKRSVTALSLAWAAQWDVSRPCNKRSGRQGYGQLLPEPLLIPFRTRIRRLQLVQRRQPMHPAPRDHAADGDQFILPVRPGSQDPQLGAHPRPEQLALLEQRAAM